MILLRIRLCRKTHTSRTSRFCMYLSWMFSPEGANSRHGRVNSRHSRVNSRAEGRKPENPSPQSRVGSGSSVRGEGKGSGIFSQRTNQTQEAWAYSHDGRIRHRKPCGRARHEHCGMDR
eukprot:388160-Prorocentrum_minimum.AAC.1